MSAGIDLAQRGGDARPTRHLGQEAHTRCLASAQRTS